MKLEGIQNFARISGIFNLSSEDHNGIGKESLVLLQIKDGGWVYVAAEDYANVKQPLYWARSADDQTLQGQLIQFLVSGIIGSIYALIALGFVTVYNAGDIINCAQGEFAVYGSLAAIMVFQKIRLLSGNVQLDLGWPLPLTVLFGVVAPALGLLLSAAYGGVAGRLHATLSVPPYLASGCQLSWW